MNHLQDILEGYATFDEERERATYEATFINKPNHFSHEIDGEIFKPARVKELHLRGKPPRVMVTPFDIEEGFAEVFGTLGGKEGTLDLRWSEFGSIREVRFRAC